MLTVASQPGDTAFDTGDRWWDLAANMKEKPIARRLFALAAGAAIDPMDYRFWYSFALQAFGRLEYEVAQHCAQRAYKLNRDDYDVCWIYVISLRRSKEYKKSIAAAKSWLKRNPETAEMLCEIAQCYEGQENWKMAIQWADKALGIAPDDELALDIKTQCQDEIDELKEDELEVARKSQSKRAGLQRSAK